MRISKLLLLGMLTGAAVLGSCNRSAVAPQETFPVVATISAFTIDSDGIGVSVPVTFKIYEKYEFNGESDQVLESITFESDNDGYVEYRHEFFLRKDEHTRIIVDVSSPTHESVQYWTAYFSAVDSPAKRVEIGLVVFPK
ncbi:MAG: hypothetical protein JSW33_07780 [bacterium]|nr:MAG: hypothetical protein JSW33_07780 [bacterium]